MVEIPFVTPEDATFAREIEKRILGLREDAGVLFVGASVTPTKKGEDPIYSVLVGCSRDMSPKTLEPALMSLFQAELALGAKIELSVKRGVART